MNFDQPELGFVRVDNAQEIDLREYQSQSIEALRQNIRAKVHSQILCSPTGSGKTMCAAFLLREAHRKGKRGIFVVDRTVLVNQTSAVFDTFGIAHGVIQAGHPRRRPQELIQVASMQTLAKRGWPQADLIIADECHCLYSSFSKHIARVTCPVIGLTATPFTRGLGKHYGAVVNVTTTNKLTREGFLVPFKVWASAEPDMTGAKVVAGEWTDNAASERAIKIVGDVVAEYERHGAGAKFICFGVDVTHCEELQRQFIRNGINVALYTYMTCDEEREIMMGEFRKHDSSIRGLISVSALSRGLDVPDIEVIISARPYKSSLAEFIQVVGRGLRPYPDKKECRILDLAGNFMRHYPAMAEFFEEGCHELDNGKKKEVSAPTPVKPEREPRKCPSCKMVVIGRVDCCPNCGLTFPRKPTIEHEKGELKQLKAAKEVLSMDKKRALFGELKYVGRMRQYKDGWAAHAYKQITGKWPNAVKDAPLTKPTEATFTKLSYLQRQRRPAPKKPVELNLFA